MVNRNGNSSGRPGHHHHSRPVLSFIVLPASPGAVWGSSERSNAVISFL